jgi:bisanhydrobacterioruberin hydratase
MLESFKVSLNEKKVIIILIILHLVGILGFTFFNFDGFFYRLTPFNLIVSLFFALCFHPNCHQKSIFFFVFTFLWGFFIELIGVNTGLIFGQYEYDFALGFEIFNTPPVIGINWVLTSYCLAVSINHLLGERKNWILKALIAALGMVVLDFFIEPVATKTGMWHWENNIIPFKNYVGWFFTALPIQLLFFKLMSDVKNKIAVVLLILMFLFFFVLNSTLAP